MIAYEGEDFVVVKLTALAKAARHRTVRFATMSAGCNQCSLSCNRSNKHISGPKNGRLLSSKDGIPRARVESFVGSAGYWTLEVSKFIRSLHRCRTNAVETTYSASGRSCRTLDKS